MLKQLLTKPVTWVAIVVLGLGGVAGLYWFAPWRLFTSTTVTDTLAAVPASPAPNPGTAAPESSTTDPATESPTTDPSTAGPSVVRTGTFVTHEYATTGAARLVRNTDGSLQLELVGLDTSDGPDLRVWLSDQEVRTGSAGWRVFDDGRYVELGRLKGNRGDQVYRVPVGVEPGDYRSVSIWCKRFSVSFGAAALA